MLGREQSTLQSKAVIALHAQRRWAVTGWTNSITFVTCKIIDGSDQALQYKTGLMILQL